MIDIHCHILPGFDDGPASMEESIDMARLASQHGIDRLVATPHSALLVGRSYGAVQIRAAVERLRGALAEQNVPVEVMPGIEAHISPNMERELGQGTALTLNGSRYLLLELPFSMMPLFAEQAIKDLRHGRRVPILAHPERLEYFQHDPNRLGQLVRLGALVQLTADSLVGGFGPRSRAAAEIMLLHGMAHFLASDAHDARSRPPALDEARRAAAKLVGDEAADALVADNPLAVIDDVQLMPVEPEKYVASRRWPW